MKQRIRKDFLPVAAEYLATQRKISEKNGPAYKHSHACKLQAKLIDVIGNVVSHLELGDEDLCRTALSCAAYLNARQPLLLQNVSSLSVAN